MFIKREGRCRHYVYRGQAIFFGKVKGNIFWKSLSIKKVNVLQVLNKPCMIENNQHSPSQFLHSLQ